ncbi:DUF6339 family protein [Kitasatospora purpeofusca]|uniref:DUF6339 family protein n=1 Tax=Kitasatospora purpeofusca TaxID=67352 RepID=UPI00225422D3|nr:DUF6339 family protein [Kitasatospora purpeofusca]MCX4756583.1 DUF6339 family protein [Kitasatospora purpeofusca]WSR35620.1 DUF6339 family protein [Kitasatospora purpeofusca]
MTRPGTDTPDRLALLSPAVAAKYLTVGVRAGREQLPQVALLRASEAVDDDSGRWDTAPVRELLDEAIHRFGDSPTDADAWLSPRLHATLRLTRAEAARPGLWNFLAMAVAPDYVLWRHLPRGEAKDGEPPTVSTPRFTGIHYTQAFARLWWAAELFRDGGDYRPVEIACRNQDMLNTAMRLDAIDHRPTALAMVRILKGLAESGATRLGDRVNALCTAVNAAGSTLMYDVIAQDDLPDPDALVSWVTEADTAPSVPWDRLPDGPPEEAVRRDSVDRLARMFQQFSEHAPLRDRGRKREAEATS